MNASDLPALNDALTRLALLKGRDLTPAMFSAYAGALSRYDIAGVIAACELAAETPGFFELACITTHLRPSIEAEALLAWAGTGGDAQTAESARVAVGLRDRNLLETDVKFLRKPFLETYAAMRRDYRRGVALNLVMERLANTGQRKTIAAGGAL